MGGIGKTTLATALYNRLLPAFSEASCFLQDVRGHIALHGNSVVDMQRMLLERLCGLSISIIDEADGEGRVCIDMCLGTLTLALRNAGCCATWRLLFCVTSPAESVSVAQHSH